MVYARFDVDVEAFILCVLWSSWTSYSDLCAPAPKQYNLVLA